MLYHSTPGIATSLKEAVLDQSSSKARAMPQAHVDDDEAQRPFWLYNKLKIARHWLINMITLGFGRTLYPRSDPISTPLLVF